MGSGDRFQWNTTGGLVFGIAFDNFPFKVTVTLWIGPLWVCYGFGKGYDE